MTELQVLQDISDKLSILIYTSGVLIGILLSTLFAKAWGKNS
jgi:hypothetical protein